MRLVLRVIGVLAGLSVVAAVVLMLGVTALGMQALLFTGTFGVTTIFGWLIAFIAGPIAFVQLVRVRNSGRIAAIVLFGYMLAYYLVELFAFSRWSPPAVRILLVCVFCAVVVGILLLPSARRTCIEVVAQERLS